MEIRKIKEQLLENGMYDALAHIQIMEEKNKSLLSCITTIRHGRPSGPFSSVYLSEYEIYKFADEQLNLYRHR